MAKKTTQQNTSPSIFEKIKKIITDSNVQFIVGLFVGALAIFLCSSFLSFFSSGGADQSVVDVANVATEVAETGKEVVQEGVKNTSGRGGAVVADFLVNKCFGWSSVFVVPFLVVIMLWLMNIRRLPLLKWFICTIFSIVWGSLFFAFALGNLFSESFMSPGGNHGEFVSAFIIDNIGFVGMVLLLVVSLVLFLTYLTRETITVLKKILSFEYLKKKNTDDDVDGDNADDDAQEDAEPEVDEDTKEGDAEEVQEVDDDEDDDEDEDFEVVDATESGDEEVLEDDEAPAEEEDDIAKKFDEMNRKITGDKGDAIDMEVQEAKGDDLGGDMHRPINPKDELSYYKPPTVDLLDKYEQASFSIDKEEQNANKNKIVEVLRNFDIEISSIKATVGPTITLYEITPAPGVRIGKIKHLEDDIAMSLAALCIRIIAPIPGKGTVGIEVPNAHKQIVPMASLLNSRKYKETDMALPLALGKTISNDVFMVDMAKMPHLLVAGATGMGKSVGLNAIITSLLYKMHPAYLKFVMVDPKMVELSLYNVLEKHFLAKLEGEDEPIITDVNKVVRTLKSLCVEMDNRYRLLQLAKVRSVKEYNEKYLNKELMPTKGHRFMPYIVVIIDEYGDLMMTAGREVEQPIARIAQKARAVGIHMIIATQRPTTNIITGTIKANFPARMAFRVISVIDSRTILDRQGANQLQGRGDMLFLAGNDPVRVQCALVETKEVERVCAHIAKQQGYTSAYILPEPDEAAGEMGGGSSSRGELTSDKLDSLFVEAARTVVLQQQGSTSLIQRKFNVGFNRAGRIMDQLCQMGIVGEQEGSKPRQVLCADEADLEFRLKQIMQ